MLTFPKQNYLKRLTIKKYEDTNLFLLFDEVVYQQTRERGFVKDCDSNFNNR